jgi:hypothetical protein
VKKKKIKQTKMTMSQYEDVMNEIIRSGLPVHETLIMMLETAAMIKIVEKKKK